jgi:hypothetical protein
MLPNASGVLVLTSIAGLSFSRTPAWSTASTRPPLGLAKTGSGVAIGAKNAVQGSAGNPVMPFSASVGTSGNSAARLAPVMAIAHRSPATYQSPNTHRVIRASP